MDEKEQKEWRRLSFQELCPPMVYGWSPVDQEIIDQVKEYIASVKGPTKDCAFYKNLLEEMDQGPQSPRARSGELQKGLKLMLYLIKEQQNG
jgi:hypothetical protein